MASRMIANCCIKFSVIRYGWFSLAELEAGVSEISLTHFENCMIPEDIQVKSSSEACVQKDGTLIRDIASEQASCKPKDQSALLLGAPSITGKNSEEEQSINASPSDSGSQHQEQDPANPANPAFEVILLLRAYCFKLRVLWLILYL